LNVIERLKPFFHRRGARQRLILYLIATGHSVPSLCRMTVKDLMNLKLPHEIIIYRDQSLDLLEDAGDKSPAFTYHPSGLPMKHADFYRIVSQATKNVLDHPLSHRQFAEYIQKKAA
jgi:hypothetical protein